MADESTQAPATGGSGLTIEAIVAVDSPREFRIHPRDRVVAYTAEAAAAVVEESPFVEGRGDTDLAIAIDRKTTDPSHYPLVLVSYIIACQEYEDAEAAAVVKAYVSYLASAEGQATAAESAGAAPLAADLSAKVAAAIATIK